MSGIKRPPRVVVLSFNNRPPSAVRSYVDGLVTVGVEVDLLLAESRGREELDIDPRVKVHTIVDETGSPLRRVERAIVSSVRGGSPLAPALRVVRPWVLTRRARGVVQELDLANVDRIVAGDPPSVPLAWRLARRYPAIRVTSALDRKPYIDG